MLDHLAYIDPSSGSLIVQATIATLVAVPFIFREQFGRAARAIRRDNRLRPPAGHKQAATQREGDA